MFQRGLSVRLGRILLRISKRERIISVDNINTTMK